MTQIVPYSKLRADMPRISLVEAVPLAKPFTVFIEPTNVCNFRCTFCPESLPGYHDRTGRHRLSWADFETIGRSLESWKPLRCLNFHMLGEGLVNKETPDMITVACSRRWAERIFLTTNGTLLTEEVADILISAKLDYLRVSIYGWDQDSLTRTTGSKISFERIRSNVKYLFERRNELGLAKPYICAKMVDPHNEAGAGRFREVFGPIADECWLEPQSNWNDEGKRYSLLGHDELMQENHFSRKKTCCPSPFYVLVVNSDMKVSVCCVDWSKSLVVGDLRKNTLQEIWTGEPLRNIQRAHIGGNRHSIPGCRDCTFIHTYPDNMDAMTLEEFDARTKGDS